MIKIDKKGKIKWSNTLEGIVKPNLKSAHLSENNTINIIYNTSDERDFYKNSLISKVDTTGKIIWTLQLPKTKSMPTLSASSSSNGGSYIVTMAKNSGMLLKVTRKGEIEWDKAIGSTRSNIEYRVSHMITDNNSIVIVGSTGALKSISPIKDEPYEDYWVSKYTTNGVLQWDKVYGGDKSEYATHITATSDGGYLAIGVSKSSNSRDVTSTTQGYGDCWIVKLSNSGQMIWDKLFGGKGLDKCYCITPTSYGSSIAMGISDSKETNFTNKKHNGDYNIFLIELDNDGNVLSKMN